MFKNRALIFGLISLFLSVTCANATLFKTWANIASIAALQAYTGSLADVINVIGYDPASINSAPDGGGGTFVYNSSDSTSADNGWSIIVDGLGRRWYRQLDVALLSTPAAPVVTSVGANNGETYTYVLVALNEQGHSLMSATGATTTGPTTRTVNNYNVIQTPLVPGATSIDVYLLEHDSSAGSEQLVGNVAPGAVYHDVGTNLQPNSDPTCRNGDVTLPAYCVNTSSGTYMTELKAGPQTGFEQDRHPAMMTWWMDAAKHKITQGGTNNTAPYWWYAIDALALNEITTTAVTPASAIDAMVGLAGLYHNVAVESYGQTDRGYGLFGDAMQGHGSADTTSVTQIMSGVGAKFEWFTGSYLNPVLWGSAFRAVTPFFSSTTSAVTNVTGIYIEDQLAGINGSTVNTYQIYSVGKAPAYFGGPVQFGCLTVSTLPTPATGMVQCVTDGDSGLAWGATAVNSGGGTTKYLVWYNGSNWTVTGK